MRLSLAALALCLLTSVPAQRLALAQDEGSPDEAGPALPGTEVERVRLDLVSERPYLVPGTTTRLGVRLRIIPGWHVYWLNSGDTGLPTEVEVKGLPKGVSAGALLWPAPVRHAHEGLVDFVYEDEVTLIVPLTVAKDVPPGTKVPLEVRASWLVCKEECVSGKGSASAALEVGQQGGKPDPEHTAALARAAARLPSELPKDVVVRLEGTRLELRAPGATRLIWFPAQPEATPPPLEGLDEQGELLRVDYPGAVRKAELLEGLLALTRGGKTTYHWIQLRPGRPGPGEGAGARR
ncbi:MAG: protein-disulfide reductase DsbD domain-containing protein [Planctomycetota bacterium]